MSTIHLQLADFSPYLLRLGPRFFKAARRGAIRGAMRGVSTLHRATGQAPPANPQQVGQGGAVNTGRYKRSWKTQAVPDGADIFNVAPYAGVIEHGRAKGFNMPLKPIANWAQRRLGLSKQDAQKVAFVIARRIKKRGLLPRKVLASSMPTIEADFLTEVRKELERELSNP